eukprot:gene22937-30120_t
MKSKPPALFAHGPIPGDCSAVVEPALNRESAAPVYGLVAAVPHITSGGSNGHGAQPVQASPDQTCPPLGEQDQAPAGKSMHPNGTTKLSTVLSLKP